eukprot:CAMPEP_0114583808 /NCGR_PEP_ID=MMETSP0125-20121206/7499_1 /TAXON_ID=485358 ORGANISM="Aristerostoma sp., Strain ATCC 50986" /NCGR_SAMPLE_ID=MMETSP0125 /ASSEMBLY_ACC=CAM_ASM_000245 /LENGTH=296 /DNA_ID=CAMNT_0001777551 /DNA_START=32 /DNA_END=924 /DNA_ORIENTATION=+
MTKIFKKTGVNSPLRTPYDDCMIVMDIKQTESFSTNPLEVKKASKLQLNSILRELVLISKRRVFRYDLVDSEITFCTHDVVNIINEQFDFADFRDDFINGILTSEILDDKIYAYVLDSNEYAGKITDFRTYGVVSHHIIYRWLYPITLTTNDLKYKEKNGFTTKIKITIAHSSKISNGSVIGRETQIGEKNLIERSSIGNNCIIGDNCKIINSYIWNNVKIENGVRIENAIIGDDAELAAGTQIQKGCVLGDKVVTKENAVIGPNELVCSNEGKFKTDGDRFKNGGVYESENFKLE